MTVVLIASHRPLIVNGLAYAIGQPNPSWLLAFGRSLRDIQHELTLRQIDVAVLDYELEDLKGEEGLRQLARSYPRLPVVVLASRARLEAEHLTLWKLSADCISDTDPTDRWLSAVKRLLAAAVDPPAMVGYTSQAVSPPIEPLIEPGPILHGRRLEVVQLLAEGNGIKQIARRLGISPGTVKTHLSLAYGTLGAHNRMEAVIRAGMFSRAQSHEESEHAQRV